MSAGDEQHEAAGAGPEAAGPRVCTIDQGPAARTLEIEVDAERVRRGFDSAYRELGRRVRLRGFRPGKAPRSVLERHYGAAVAEELERTLVSETLPTALADSHLAPVSEPAVESEPPVDGQTFRYRARVEVKPDIQLPDLRGLRARRPTAEVSEADVERELEALRQRQAVLVEEPEGTPAAPGHFLTVSFEGRVGGKPFRGGSGREQVVELGSGRMLPGFDEQLAGARAGERRTVRASLPKDHPSAALAGQEAEFEVEVLAVRRREVPPLDDELAKDVGDFASLDALRAELRRRLTEAREREARGVLRRTLLDDLIARARFEVPPGAAEQRLRNRLALARRELAGRVDARALEAQLARWEEEWRSEAEREVREQWLLEAVAREHGIEAEPLDVDTHLERLAAQEGVPAARLRKRYEEAGLLDALRARLRDEKAVEFLLAGARVEAVTSS